jgi:predicted Zn-dependent protease
MCRDLLPPASDGARRLQILLARAHHEAGRDDDAREAIETGLARFPDDVELILLEAQSFVRCRNLPGAAARLLSVPFRRGRTMHMVRARTLLGEIQLALGQFEAAEQIARDVVGDTIGYGAAWLLLADALLAQGKSAELDSAFAELRTTHGSELACEMIRRAQLAYAGRPAAALEAFPEVSTDELLVRLGERLRQGRTNAPILACLQTPWT